MGATDFNTKLGQRIKKLRKAQKLSQEALAELVNKSVDTISNIERGIFPPRIETALEIATALGIPLHELFQINDVPATDKEKAALLDEIYDMLKAQPNELLEFTLAQTKELIALKESFINRLRK
jgi:transcriptional regulator with XRE-family HTH domain